MGQVNSHRESWLLERHSRPAPASGGEQPAAENSGIPGLFRTDHRTERLSPKGVLAEEGRKFGRSVHLRRINSHERQAFWSWGGLSNHHIRCPSVIRPGATKSAQSPNPAPATTLTEHAASSPERGLFAVQAKLHHLPDLAQQLDLQAMLGRVDHHALDQAAQDGERLGAGPDRAAPHAAAHLGAVDLSQVGVQPQRRRRVGDELLVECRLARSNASRRCCRPAARPPAIASTSPSSLRATWASPRSFPARRRLAPAPAVHLLMARRGELRDELRLHQPRRSASRISSPAARGGRPAVLAGALATGRRQAR